MGAGDYFPDQRPGQAEGGVPEARPASTLLGAGQLVVRPAGDKDG